MALDPSAWIFAISSLADWLVDFCLASWSAFPMGPFAPSETQQVAPSLESWLRSERGGPMVFFEV